MNESHERGWICFSEWLYYGFLSEIVTVIFENTDLTGVNFDNSTFENVVFKGGCFEETTFRNVKIWDEILEFPGKEIKELLIK